MYLHTFFRWFMGLASTIYNLLADITCIFHDEISKQIIKLVENHSSSLPEPTNNMPAYVCSHGDHHDTVQCLFGIISWSESASHTRVYVKV